MSEKSVETRGRDAARAVRDEVGLAVDARRSFQRFDVSTTKVGHRTGRRVVIPIAACIVVVLALVGGVVAVTSDESDRLAVQSGEGATVPQATTDVAYAFLPNQMPDGFRAVVRQDLGLGFDGSVPTPLGTEPPNLTFARAYGDVPSFTVRVLAADHSRPSTKAAVLRVRGQRAELTHRRDNLHHANRTVRWVERDRVIVVSSIGMSKTRLLQIAERVGPVDRAAFEGFVAGVPEEPNGPTLWATDRFRSVDGTIVFSDGIEGGEFAGGTYEVRLRSVVLPDARWTCLSSRVALDNGARASGDVCADPAYGFTEPQVLDMSGDGRTFVAVSLGRKATNLVVRLNDGRRVNATVVDTGEGERPQLFIADLGVVRLRPGGTILGMNARGQVVERWRFGPPK